jgi:hypothetical protein
MFTRLLSIVKEPLLRALFQLLTDKFVVNVNKYYFAFTMSSESDSEPVVKKVKRQRNEGEYKRNIIKNSRVKGLQYSSYSGKKVDAKVQETFSCKCAEKCYSNLSEERKIELWDYFYSLDSKNTQDAFLQSLIEKREAIRRRKPKKGMERPIEEDAIEMDNDEVDSGPVSKKPKDNFFTYNIKVNGTIQEVCKNTFMKLHGITASRVRRLCNLLVAGKCPKDLRGKSRSGNAVSGEVCQVIHDHIAKYNLKTTHYGGKPKNYLDARLNVKIMHQMFLEEYPVYEGIVKYKFFLQYYKENFNYSFGRPQIDVCSACEAFSMQMRDKQLSDNAKRNVAAEQILHKRRARKFYDALRQARENEDDDTAAICFDFMATQPLPRIPVQEVFYLRQLNVNIFCIHDLKSGHADLHLYHEGEAAKSPNEVCTFLWKYIQKLPKTVKKLYVFSDGTGGQNKNHTLLRFLLFLRDSERFEKIIHFFPVRGHSFMPCDRDFGVLKRSLRTSDRIYTLEQYGELFLRSSTKGRFTIHYIKTEEILDFHKWWPVFYKKQTCSDETSGRGVPKEEKVLFKISNYKQFILNKEFKGKVVARHFIGGLIGNTFSLAKTRQSPQPPAARAYVTGKLPIKNEKVMDLQKLKPYLIGYEDFYDVIYQWPTSVEDNDSTNEDGASD